MLVLMQTMKRITVHFLVYFIAFSFLILALPSANAHWPNIPDGVNIAEYPRIGNGYVDSPSSYIGVKGKWGTDSPSVYYPTASLFGTDTGNYSGENDYGTISYYDSQSYHLKASGTHWAQSGWFNNGGVGFSGTPNPYLIWPPSSTDQINQVVVIVKFDYYQPEGFIQINYDTNHNNPYNWHNSAVYDESVFDITWDITGIFNFTPLTIKSDDFMIRFNYTGSDYDWTIIDYIGIYFKYSSYLSPLPNHASYREESILEPYYITEDFIGQYGYQYIATRGFSNPSYPGGWTGPYSLPRTNDTITDVKIIMTAHSQFISPGWLSFSLVNTSKWNKGQPWLSDNQSGASWFNSSTYDLTVSNATGDPNLLEGYLPMQYTWDVFNLTNWTPAILKYYSPTNQSPLTIMWTMFLDGTPVKIDYLGLYYTFNYTGSAGGGGSLPTVEMAKNTFGFIWLLIVFLPSIVMTNAIPKVGFVAGMTLMLIIVSLVHNNFIPFMLIGLIGMVILVYKGN